MTNFEFRLENLLELRSEAETEAAGRLAEAQVDAEQAQRTYDAMQTARVSAQHKLCQLQSNGSNAGRLQSLRLVLDRVEQSLRAAGSVSAEAQEALGHARAAYHRANRERRALEELKVKRHEDWSRDAARRDQRAMDEVAALRHSRSSGSVSSGGEF